MKIALFSDIHANLPALEAMFKSLDAQKPDAVYCLGDMVGYNVWPNEVVNSIRKRGIPAIAGNYDQGIGLESDECGCAYKTEEDKAMGKISIAYTNEVMGKEERNYLRTLPAHIRLEFQTEKEKFTILLVHGSPRKINEYLFEDREEKSFLRMMEAANADIMCFGHTHKPFHRIISSGTEDAPRYRHAVNTGSVGKPKDNNPSGCYIIIEIDSDSVLSDKNAVKIDFVRFDYDIEKAAAGIEQSKLPKEYAAMLRKGN
ncbi:MAG: metallophosphoesterase family protein [Gemmatimonadaceae bacterium]|nr:metallophosphoesterase family protein [Chitinophagaceae bacterium]